MRKILALLLALAMLLGACACAEGLRLSVTDMKVYENDEMSMDLTGFCAELAAATIGEEDSGLRLYCSADGQALINFTIGEAEGKSVIGYGEGEGFSKCYQFSNPMSLHDQILEFDLIGTGDWTLVDALRGVIPAAYQEDGGAARYDGEDCTVTNFEISEQSMDTLLQLFAMTAEIQPSLQQKLQAAGFDNLQDALNASNLHLSLSGGLYEGADFDALDMNVSVTLQQLPFDIELRVEHTPVAEGHLFDLYAQFRLENESISATAQLAAVMDDDAYWLPLDISGAEEIDPQNLDAQALTSELMDGLKDMLSVAGSGAMSVMLKNQLSAM